MIWYFVVYGFFALLYAVSWVVYVKKIGPRRWYAPNRRRANTILWALSTIIVIYLTVTIILLGVGYLPKF